MCRSNGAAAADRRLLSARRGAAESTGPGEGRFAALSERFDEERD
jgi:hypothetical protein